ncbi:MAG: DUF2085 domain-containing protein [Thermoplasmata archaeon]|nr:DUF2085 domain-containing protein [Thermoplasmata archaeon]
MTGRPHQRRAPAGRRRSPTACARRAHVLILVVTILVDAALFLAPLSEPEGTVDLGERPGANRIDKQTYTDEINPFARPIYVFGDATCHQKASRSLFINGNQMPVCARDVGVYLGLTAGALLFLLFPRRYSMWWALVLIVPLGIDGTVQLVTSYDSNNLLRVATGMMYGGVIGLLFVQIAYEICGMRLKRPKVERRIERALGFRHLRPRDPFRDGDPRPRPPFPPR